MLEVLILVAHTAIQKRAEAALLFREIYSGKPPEAVGNGRHVSGLGDAAA